MITTQFKTTILSFGNNTGIEVPEKNILALGKSKKPAIIIDMNGFTFQSTVAVRNEKYLISFSREHRQKSGYKGGDEVLITLTLIEGKREVEIPDKFEHTLKIQGLLDVFNNCNYSVRKEMIRKITDAKKVETKNKHLKSVINELKAKQYIE